MSGRPRCIARPDARRSSAGDRSPESARRRGLAWRYTNDLSGIRTPEKWPIWPKRSLRPHLRNATSGGLSVCADILRIAVIQAVAMLRIVLPNTAFQRPFGMELAVHVGMDQDLMTPPVE